MAQRLSAGHEYEPHRSILIGLDKQHFERKIVKKNLPMSFNICFEHPQHMFWLRNKKIILWYALFTKVLKLYYILN